ncbi:MAG: hypothetical protein LBJ94_03595 [Puniceicoccales bacterium]|jgi:hypothetical protein|nr:hypothetical protein [Puniceicoccales bacterium]
MLNSFVKNKIGLDCEEDAKNLTLNGDDGNEVYIEQVSSGSVFVSCTIRGMDLVDIGEDFYKRLLEENDRNDRQISPLYWSVSNEENRVSCGGFVVFQDLNTCEDELYSLVCTLIGYNFNNRESDAAENNSLDSLPILINRT